MDREIPKTWRRRRQWRQVGGAAALVGGLALAVGLLWRSLQPPLLARNLQIVAAELGSVENTLAANGEVIPAYEQVLTSPIRASIERIALGAGAAVIPGSLILKLDQTLAKLEYEKLGDQVALKRNQIEQLKLQLQKSLRDAELENQIKDLAINRLQAQLEDTRRLQRVGGRTQEDVQQAENALKIAQLEQAQLENQLRYLQQSMGASIQEATLAASIEGRNLAEYAFRLQKADVKADRAGVLTWVNDQIGASVGEGDPLARIADLGSFHIQGRASDVYTGRLQPGLPVLVRLDTATLRGSIVTVEPAVKNNEIRFEVALDDQQHAELRPNRQVELFVITQKRSRVVRVPNGPAFAGQRQQEVFVVEAPGRAQRRTVTIGLSNFDYVEIEKGLQVGERIIITDLSAYRHRRIITIK